MAATLSGAYSSAPDTPSPVYPDRLIRPLPKRPLRSRLSQEAADSILYPPAPPATQLFYGAYSENGGGGDGNRYMQRNSDPFRTDQSPDRSHRHLYENGVEFESGDEDGPVVVRRSAGFRGSSLSRGVNGQPYPGNVDGSQPRPPVSGPDSYDAFENTNNKKKRKIPTSGNLGSHHSSITTDLANMGLSGSTPASPIALGDGGSVGSYYGPGNSAAAPMSGISGPGRGRFGRSTARSSNGRNPLSAHTQSSWLNSRPGANRRDLAPSSLGPSGESEVKSDRGIISTAIANVAALSSPLRGQENVSLLDQQTNKSTPAKTQFTFTCESDSSKGMALQPQNPYPLPQHQRQPNSSTTVPSQQPFATQGTQTSPNISGQQTQSGAQQPAQGMRGNAAGKKARRSPGSIYALAARRRKIQQQYTNLHHPPNSEDIWICEFCEYEAIFGHPPEALIRQYEIKDRKERRRLTEKRRLLEKAKMKGRKGKKATKNAAKHAAAQQAPHHQGYDHQPANHAPLGAHGHLRDDYVDNEYDKESISIPTPPHQVPIKHPMSAGNQAKSATLTNSPKGVAGGGSVRPA